MIDPFRLMTNWMTAGRMVSETLDASNMVIARRGQTIADAAQDPIGADHRELARMVNEKGAAFAKSGASLAGDWAAMQDDLFAQANAMRRMMLSGSVPSASAATAMVARSQRIGERALASGIRALKPIHATATANKRRLSKAR